MHLYFHHYSHANDARCGYAYLAEINQQPDELKDESMSEKGAEQKFTQMDHDHSHDHSLKWLNAPGKRGDSILRKHRNYTKTYSLRNCIATKMQEVFMIENDCKMTSWLEWDNEENKIVPECNITRLFCQDSTCLHHSPMLHHSMNKFLFMKRVLNSFHIYIEILFV